MVFLGNDFNSKAYRCYDPEARKVVISRNVKFIEDSHQIQDLSEKTVEPQELIVGGER